MLCLSPSHTHTTPSVSLPLVPAHPHNMQFGMYKLYEAPIKATLATAATAATQVVTFVRWFVAESATGPPRPGGRAALVPRPGEGASEGEEEEEEEEGGEHVEAYRVHREPQLTGRRR